jgi:hypothetical protein
VAVARRRLALPGAVAAALLAMALLTGSARGATASSRSFITPGSNGASCDLVATSASCGVGPPRVPAQDAVKVVLTPSGKMTACYGNGCTASPPAKTPTLAYGHAIALGPFTCTSEQAGVRCVVTKTGHGYLLGRRGFKKV